MISQTISNVLFNYTDDILIDATVKSLGDYSCLQYDLFLLQEWTTLWQIEFNPSKCKQLMISNKQSFIQSSYKLCGHIIKKVSCAKYLGIIFDQNLTWKEHINSVCSKANVIKALLQRNLTHGPNNVKYNCYKTLLRPVLEYAITVWSPFT